MSDTVTTDAIDEILNRMATIEGALLPILHAIQAVEVHGVISYYHHFRQKPAGKVVVQICRAEACQAVGGDAFAQEAVKALGCDFHETTKDGAVTLEPVYCLGHCACGPSAMINDDVHARMTIERLKTLVERARSQA
jgi:formate dehydrogenase subunit gamma